MRRTSLQKTPQKIYGVLCEGRETEPIYVDALIKASELREVGVEFVVLPHCGKTNPQGLYEAATKTLKQKGYEKIFIIRDGDKDPNPVGKDKKIVEIISTPCIEFWFLLHFADGKKPFDKCDDVIAMLKKKEHLPNYEKNQTDLFERLKPYQGVARERAASLYNESTRNRTNFHEFIETIQKISKTKTP